MKNYPKSYVKIEPKSRDPYLRRTEGEMIKIVKEIESGLISIRTACFKYGLCRNTLKLFITKLSIRTLGDDFSTQIRSRMNDSQKESTLNKKIQQLTKELEYAKLKIISLETMIAVAEDDLKIKIRKKRGTKQSKE
jgi:predicted  nucleic acid-binding Zn-ribbon protein